jgi:hypothetical protein
LNTASQLRHRPLAWRLKTHAAGKPRHALITDDQTRKRHAPSRLSVSAQHKSWLNQPAARAVKRLMGKIARAVRCNPVISTVVGLCGVMDVATKISDTYKWGSTLLSQLI